MDVSVASYYIERKKNNKGSQMGHNQKKFKKIKIKNDSKFQT